MLSDEEFAEIQGRAESVPGSSLAKTQRELSAAFFDRTRLVAEATALRERLATLQAVADRLNYGETGWPRVLQLQDELARRDARLATATPIVEAVRDGCTMAVRPEANWCAACLCVDDSDTEEWSGSPHDDDCPVTQARAWLVSLAGGEVTESEAGE